MRQSTPRYRVGLTYLFAVASAAVLVVACEMESPNTPQAKPVAQAANGPVPVLAQEPYFEFQVEVPVKPAPGSAMPRYPNLLRQAAVEGEVLAQFVVDTTGRAEVGSLKILKSSHDLFTESVRTALPQMRFVPADVGGKKVKQLVQEPFSFSMSR